MEIKIRLLTEEEREFMKKVNTVDPEQHRFEQHGSTYMWIFSNKYTGILGGYFLTTVKQQHYQLH